MKVGRYEVKIKSSLGWFDAESLRYEPAFQQADVEKKVESTEVKNPSINKDQLEAISMMGDMMSNSKLKVWAKCIEEIKEGDKVIPYSEEWVKGLTREEGDAIDQAIRELAKKK